MNGPDAPPPDWRSIFDRAHRRVFQRLLLLAGIGAAGALLLLSSGLNANGTFTWLARNDVKKHPTEGNKHPPHHHRHHPPKPHPGPHPHPHPRKKKHHRPRPPECKKVTRTIAGKEYHDCVPRAGG